MVRAFCLLLVLAAPLISGFTITTPTNWASSGPVTITWTSSTTDANLFSIELINTVFNDAFALGNNIPTSEGSFSLTLPVVPAGDGYSLEFVNVSNINQVFVLSSQFSIAAPASSSSSGSASSTSSTASASGSKSSSSSGTASGNSSTSATSASGSTSTSSSGFGTTVSNTGTSSSASVTSPSSSSTSNTGTAAGSSGTILNAASPLSVSLPTTFFAIMAISAIVGALVV